MIVRRTLALAALSLMTLAACEAADPTVPNNTPSGEVHFTYTGADEGTYDAEGQVNTRNTDDGTWAAGQRTLNQQGGTVLAVLGQIERSDGLLDQVYIAALNPTVGEIVCEADDACNFDVLFALGLDSRTDDTEEVYKAASGTLRITSLTSGRATGEFVVTMEEAFPPNGQNPAVVEITAGTFDVPLIN